MVGDGGARPPGLVSFLRNNPVYARLYAGIVISRLGTNISAHATLPVAAYNITDGSPWFVALVIALRYAPETLVGWIAGPLVDRVDRTRLMFAADLVRAVLIGSAAFTESLAALFAISFALGSATAFFTPAYQATLPETVRSKQDLLRANTFLYSSRSAVDLGAPALGTLLISTAGVGAAFLLDAVTYVVSGLFVLSLARFGVGRPQAGPEGAGGVSRFFRDLADGVAYHRQVPLIRDLLFLIGITGLSIGGLNALLTIVVGQQFHRAPEEVGLIGTTMAAGIMLGNLTLSYVGSTVTRPVLLAAGYLLSGAAALAVLQASSFLTALGLFFVAGFANAAFFAPPEAWVQETADPRLLGRVSSLRNLTLSTSMLVSTLAAGACAAAIGLGPAWACLSALMILCGVLALALPSLRSTVHPPAAGTETKAGVQA